MMSDLTKGEPMTEKYEELLQFIQSDTNLDIETILKVLESQDEYLFIESLK